MENCLKDESTSSEISSAVTEVLSEDSLPKRRIVECVEDDSDKTATLWTILIDFVDI